MKLIHMVIFMSSLFSSQNNNRVFCTIDVNLSELEYLAGHLEPPECRRLVAALHYNTFELPESIAGAERKVDEDMPCLRQLLHWNNSPGEGRGETHEDIEHRLRQINRNDLADWLGKTTFKQLGKDLGRALDHPFDEGVMQETEPQSSATLEPTDEPSEEDGWLPVDTLLFATLAVLITTLIIVCLALAIHSIRLRRSQENNYSSSSIDRERGNDGMIEGSQESLQNAKKKKKLKVNRIRKGSKTRRKSGEDSGENNSFLETEKEKNCCGTSCNIL